MPMTAVALKLDECLRRWNAAKAEQVERLVGDIIVWADADALDMMRSCEREQEVLDLLEL